MGLFAVVYKLVNVVLTLEWYSHSQERYHNQVIGINIGLLPEAICCCLQTCKCGFDIRVVLYQVSVRNANTTKL